MATTNGLTQVEPVLPNGTNVGLGVSVVIPAYNYAKFLPDAIDSALNQNYGDIEIIVVDDGSTDDTPAVCARYGDRIRYIRKVNGGLPAARNTGIQAATKPFIGFLDADDIWAPKFLQQVMGQFHSTGDEYGLVAAQATYVDELGKEFVLKELTWQVHGRFSHRDILVKTRFSPSGVVARKKALLDAGCFDESLRSSEDRDMWIRIGAKYPIFLLADKLILVRRHRHSMSRNAGRMRENIFRVLRKSLDAGLVSGSESSFWRQAKAFAYYQTAWMYYEQGDRREALRDWFYSFLAWPWFANPERLNEPSLFRLRTLRRFLFIKP
jgi:glycosyltransferase involved in cell wall biosynthesis